MSMSATLSFGIETDDVGGIVAPIATSDAAWDLGWHTGIQDGSVGNYGEQCTGRRAVRMVIGPSGDLTAGKIELFLEYIILN